MTICRPYLPRFLVSAVIGWCVLPLALACQICFPIPRNSAADHLIAADRVVLARENPEKPFSLKAVEVLKGDGDGPEIDLFLDSSTRRILAMFPMRHLVCVHKANGPEAGWQRIGMADEVSEPLIREILNRVPTWENAPGERPAFFAPFLGNENSQIRTLAHIEVARAPYRDIKALGNILPREELHAFLGNVRYLEWHALYILLLAQSEDERDRDLIAERVRTAERFGTTNQLAAWTTAWIEIDEEAAFEFLELEYLQDPDRKPEEISALLMALSVHGNNGDVRLHDRITGAYRMILESHPKLAPPIVGDLTAWKRWDIAEPVAAIIASPPQGIDSTAVLQIRAYLRQAGEAQGTKPSSSTGANEPTLLVVLAALVLVPAGLLIATGILKQRQTRGP